MTDHWLVPFQLSAAIRMAPIGEDPSAPNPPHLAKQVGTALVVSLIAVGGLANVLSSAAWAQSYEVMAWAGLMVPAKTPREVVEAVHKAAVAVLGKPEISKRFEDLGYLVVTNRPEEMQAYVKSEINKYAKIIRQIGMPLQ